MGKWKTIKDDFNNTIAINSDNVVTIKYMTGSTTINALGGNEIRIATSPDVCKKLIEELKEESNA